MAIRRRGNSFVADYYDGDGKRRWKTFRLEREARAFVARVRQEILRGEHVPEAEMPRFTELAKRFLDSKRGKVRDLTLDHYEMAIETYLAPYFGKLRLNRITVALIERYRSELREGLPEPLLHYRANRLAALAAKRAARLGNPALARSAEYFRARLARKRLSRHHDQQAAHVARDDLQLRTEAPPPHVQSRRARRTSCRPCIAKAMRSTRTCCHRRRYASCSRQPRPSGAW